MRTAYPISKSRPWALSAYGHTRVYGSRSVSDPEICHQLAKRIILAREYECRGGRTFASLENQGSVGKIAHLPLDSDSKQKDVYNRYRPSSVWTE